jgi:RNA polymerase sigma-70 factor (ECF subfamily)
LRDLARQDDLDAWVLATAPRAVAYATSLLHDRTQAEDVVQDCYCRLLQRAHVYDLPRDGLKLLFRSITNACINVSTRKRPVVSLDALKARDSEGAAMEIADRSAQEPGRILMDRELEEAVAQGLTRLPDQQRAALELKSLGQTQQEIAEILNITATYAGVLIHRARQAMAEYLAPYVGETLG